MTTVAKRAARAVADLSQGTILAVVEIDAPPERVFAALTDPAAVVQWWGSAETYRVTSWEGDLRVGGAWRSGGVGTDGKPFSVGGEYLTVDPPHRLSLTWKPGWDAGQPTTVHYTLLATATGTRVTVRHEGFTGRPESCQDHASGWERVLGWLTGFLAPVASEPVAEGGNEFFVCRLVPPRPTFAFDMSPAEAAVMGEHAAYLRALAAKDLVVVFGPVADPSGVWGLAVVRVRSEEEVHRIAAEDPTILSGLGFRYEVLPMLSAVLRG